MASAREKGKIARGEWPKILARYNGGETIAQIGRDYGCTAPAIRYIIKRTGTLRDQAAGASSPGGGAPASVRQPRSHAWSESAVDKAPSISPAAVGPRGEQPLAAELRKRVTGDIAGFLVALDLAMLDTSADAVADLQDAADRLMRSTARVRLELERLADAHGKGAGGAKGARTPMARPYRS